jgi:single-stranded-DNA-specific exonuclease
LIKDEDMERTIVVDIKISVSLINLQLAELLEKLQPFGIGNPQPLFYSQVELIAAQIFGKKNEHLKLIVKDPVTNEQDSFLELIAFNQSSLFSKLSREQRLGVVYTIELDRWGEKKKVRGKVQTVI